MTRTLVWREGHPSKPLEGQQRESVEWVQGKLESKRSFSAPSCAWNPWKLRRKERKGWDGRRGNPSSRRRDRAAVDHVWGIINLQLTSGKLIGFPRSPNCPCSSMTGRHWQLSPSQLQAQILLGFILLVTGPSFLSGFLWILILLSDILVFHPSFVSFINLISLPSSCWQILTQKRADSESRGPTLGSDSSCAPDAESQLTLPVPPRKSGLCTLNQHTEERWPGLFYLYYLTWDSPTQTIRLLYKMQSNKSLGMQKTRALSTGELLTCTELGSLNISHQQPLSSEKSSWGSRNTSIQSKYANQTFTGKSHKEIYFKQFFVRHDFAWLKIKAIFSH